MSEKSITIEHHFSNIGEKWLYFATLIIGTLFGNILFIVGLFTKSLEIASIQNFITGVIIFNIVMLSTTLWIVYIMLPVFRLDFLVSKECFKFDLQRKLFLKVFWKDIEVLEIIKVGRRNYKINYMKLYQTFTFRLYIFFPNKKKQKMVLNLLKQHAITAGVNIKEGKKEVDDPKEYLDDYREARAIIRSSNKWSSLFKRNIVKKKSKVNYRMKLKTYFLVLIINLFGYMGIFVIGNLLIMFLRDTFEGKMYHLAFVIAEIVIYSMIIILVNRFKHRFLTTNPSERQSKYQIWFFIISLIGIFLTVVFVVLNNDFLQPYTVAYYDLYFFVKTTYAILGYLGIFLLFLGFFLLGLLGYKDSE